MNIKAAVFDVDGTLIDSLMFWDILWQEIGKTFLNDETFRPSADDDKRVRTLTFKDAMYLLHDRYAVAESGGELLGFGNAMIVKFYSEIVELKAGVKPFLEYCRQNGVKMCIASATAADMLEIALKRCGIRDYFAKVFSCADLGVGKDKPAVVLRAMKFLGTTLRKRGCLKIPLLRLKRLPNSVCRRWESTIRTISVKRKSKRWLRSTSLPVKPWRS